MIPYQGMEEPWSLSYYVHPEPIHKGFPNGALVDDGSSHHGQSPTCNGRMRNCSVNWLLVPPGHVLTHISPEMIQFTSGPGGTKSGPNREQPFECRKKTL